MAFLTSRHEKRIIIVDTSIALIPYSPLALNNILYICDWLIDWLPSIYNATKSNDDYIKVVLCVDSVSQYLVINIHSTLFDDKLDKSLTSFQAKIAMVSHRCYQLSKHLSYLQKNKNWKNKNKNKTMSLDINTKARSQAFASDIFGGI